MFSNYGSLASVILRRGVSTRKSLVPSRHGKVYAFRPAVNKIIRHYCAVKSSRDGRDKISDRALTTEISEILDSPDKIERDRKHYRSARLTVLQDVIISLTTSGL